MNIIHSLPTILQRAYVLMRGTPLQRNQFNNILMALSIMASVPSQRVSLVTWRSLTGNPFGDLHEEDSTKYWRRLSEALSDEAMKDNDCNTHGCIAGHLSAYKHFQDQGLNFIAVSSSDQSPRMYFKELSLSDDPIYNAQTASRVLFGADHCFNMSFGHHGYGKVAALESLKEAKRQLLDSL